MNEDRLIGSWKDPQSQDGTTTNHPAGDVRLGEPSMIGRRARLLAGMLTGTAAVILAMGDTPGTTHTAISL